MKRSRAALLLSLLYIPPLGVVDSITGSDLSLLVLYLVPIAASTWYAGLAEGIAISLVALATWVTADLLFPSHVDLPRQLLLVWGIAEKTIIFGLVVSLVLRLRNLLELERRRAFTDPVTGLPNRRAFNRSLGDTKTRGAPFSLVFMELDGLDDLFNEHGDTWTESLLREIAAVSKRFVSGFRYTDERFAAILPEVGGTTAVRRMGALMDAVTREALESKGLSSLHFKIGIAYCEAPAATSLSHLVRFLADGVRELRGKEGDRLEFFQFS